MIRPHNKPDWESIFAAIEAAKVPADFLSDDERHQTPHPKDPFEGWQE
jgi:hypothetical protein